MATSTPTQTRDSLEQALWRRAEDVIPQCTQTAAKARPPALAGVMPGFLTHGRGTTVFDLSGRAYLDFDCSLGAVVLGYSHPEVDEAVREQLGRGVVLPMAHPLEVEVAERVRAAVPCAERVRFLKTGGDANSACVRIARAHTGRPLIVTTSYHGWHDAFMFDQPGVPEAVGRQTLWCPHGDPDRVEALLRDHAGSVAAVVVTPADWERAGSREELQALRALTHRCGALLIFDEVITGFRLSLGGGQAHFGVTPDLAAFGKAISNGLPLAAYAGAASVMEPALRRTRVTATCAGETLSLAAARATLDLMGREPVHEHLWRLGERLKRGIALSAQRHAMPLRISGSGPFFAATFEDASPGRASAMHDALAAAMLSRGVFTRGRRWLISYAHTDTDVDRALSVFDRAIEEVARGGA